MAPADARCPLLVSLVVVLVADAAVVAALGVVAAAAVAAVGVVAAAAVVLVRHTANHETP